MRKKDQGKENGACTHLAMYTHTHTSHAHTHTHITGVIHTKILDSVPQELLDDLISKVPVFLPCFFLLFPY